MKRADIGTKTGYGALVGWTGERLGDKVMLSMESVRSTHLETGEGEVDSFRYFLTRSQAAVLANYLYEVAGQTPPRYRPRKRGWLSRVFAGAP